MVRDIRISFLIEAEERMKLNRFAYIRRVVRSYAAAAVRIFRESTTLHFVIVLVAVIRFVFTKG